MQRWDHLKVQVAIQSCFWFNWSYLPELDNTGITTVAPGFFTKTRTLLDAVPCRHDESRSKCQLGVLPRNETFLTISIIDKIFI